MFTMVMTSSLAVPLARMKRPCSYLLISFNLKPFFFQIIRIAMPAHFLFLLGWSTCIPFFYSKAVSIFNTKMCFSETTDRWILFLDAFSYCLLDWMNKKFLFYFFKKYAFQGQRGCLVAHNVLAENVPWISRAHVR